MKPSRLSSPQRVFITRRIPPGTLELLRRELPHAQVRVFAQDRPPTQVELRALATNCDALICTLADTLDRRILKRFTRLRVIATYAVGTNNIDLGCARERGIVVANTPGVLTDATAELAVGLMLAVMRRLVEGDLLTRQGRFPGWAPLFHLGRGLCGKTVGIIGAGRIGRRVGEMLARGFGCRILYFSRRRAEEFERDVGAVARKLDVLLRESDVVTLHAPLTDATRHLLNARRLALMKPTAVLINTARGPLVDEAALASALAAGRLGGAGLDVYEKEPRVRRALLKLRNVVLLPHIGSATVETRERMGLLCARAVIDVLKGREPAHRVV